MSLNKIVVISNKLYAGNHTFTCAHGKGGFKTDKREGDGATPIGSYALRQCLYRPDRNLKLHTSLPLHPIAPDDGWCDDPSSKLYNLPVKIPFNQSHEIMWRDDHVYDIVIPLGYNDAPIIAGNGSAIFMHLAKPNYEGTEGCIALALPDMLALLPLLSAQTTIEIKES